MSEWATYLDAYGLTIKEAKLFAAMTDGITHSKDDLLARVWGGGHCASWNLINTHMHRIRGKVAPFGFAIDSGRGRVGYRLYRPDGLPLSAAAIRKRGGE